jgi:hypothetical protein
MNDKITKLDPEIEVIAKHLQNLFREINNKKLSQKYAEYIVFMLTSDCIIKTHGMGRFKDYSQEIKEKNRKGLKAL